MRSKLTATVLAAFALALVASGVAAAKQSDLWRAYNQTLSRARYIDLTHTLTPNQPVWKGFGPAIFSPTVNPETGQAYTYAKDGFEATAYTLSTDQFGTQFDPPAHWAPEQAAIDEVPASYAVRPLVVINTVPDVRKDPKDFLTVPEVRAWERRHGRIPAGSVVMVRSDWSKRWTADPVKARELAADTNFPSVALATLKFLHRKRHIRSHARALRRPDRAHARAGRRRERHLGPGRRGGGGGRAPRRPPDAARRTAPRLPAPRARAVRRHRPGLPRPLLARKRPPRLHPLTVALREMQQRRCSDI